MEQFKIENPRKPFSLKHAQMLVPVPQSLEDLTAETIDIFKFRRGVEQRVLQATGYAKALLFFKHDLLQRAFPNNNLRSIVQHFILTLECGVFETD